MYGECFNYSLCVFGGLKGIGYYGSNLYYNYTVPVKVN